MKKNIKKQNNGKFSQAHKKVILECYKNGIEIKDDICSYLGIHHNTLNNWINEGKITKEEILQVKLGNKVIAVNTIVEAMKSSRDDVALRAAQWWLERKYPQEFSTQYEERHVRSTLDRISIKIIEIIKREVPNPEVRSRIADRLRDLYDGIEV